MMWCKSQLVKLVWRLARPGFHIRQAAAQGGPQSPQIPPWVEKVGETTVVKKSRLQYQSRKRGMLENCILLSTFAAKHLPGFGDVQLAMYDRLINLPSNDWDIYYWATGVRETPLEFDNEVMDLLKVHVQNPGRELRAIQPELFQPT